MLKQAGDRIWAIVPNTNRNHLFTNINEVEKASKTNLSKRKKCIENALRILKSDHGLNFSPEDYSFIESRLKESDRRTNP